MGHLKNKSELNLDSAEYLHDNSMYPAVAHCAYYSCVQLMRHMWVNKMGKSLEDLGVSARKNVSIGSHETLINEIKAFLKEKSLDDRTFNNTIVQLKKLRTKSDYDNIQIDSTISSNSITLSKSTIIILKKAL